MKLGKTDWDLIFLEFIEMSGRDEILDPLDPYYDSFKKEAHLTQGYLQQYNLALEKVKHLEGKSSFTEDEFHEWEGTVGWFETIGEEIGFREESLATGLIIALWKLVNHLSDGVSQGLKSRSIALQNNKFDIFRLGPKISIEYWAHSLNAASNYVRHADDWKKNLTPLVRNGTGNWKTDIPNSSQFNDSKRNLGILENIGLEVNLLLSSNDLSYSVAKKLGILDKADAKKIYFEWVCAVFDFTKIKLGK